MPKLKRLVIYVVLLLLPVVASAIGLGTVRLQSALNQPLRAQIPLLSTGNNELDDIQIQLASRESFELMEMERPYFLTKLRFKTKRLPSGEAVIAITTHDPITEPFVDFLLDVRWPEGQLFRGYTLLLDPPTPQPLNFDAEKIDEPAPEPKAAPKPVAKPAPSPLAYGPVLPTESLKSISDHLSKQTQVHHEPIQKAIKQENPQAFAQQDGAFIKAGSVLSVPHPEAIKKTHQAQPLALLKPAASFDEADSQSNPQKELGVVQLVNPNPVAEVASLTDDETTTAVPAKRLQAELLVTSQALKTTQELNKVLKDRLAKMQQDFRKLQQQFAGQAANEKQLKTQLALASARQSTLGQAQETANGTMFDQIWWQVLVLMAAVLAIWAGVWWRVHGLPVPAAAVEKPEEEPPVKPVEKPSTDVTTDPLDIAARYQRFGRFRDAERVLQEAVDGDPDREDLKAALEALHHETTDEVRTAETTVEQPSKVEKPTQASESADDDEPVDIKSLSVGDAMATRLDLAQVYIDMRDFSEAKLVLQEVQEKGTDEQREQAQQMLDQINKESE